MAAMTEKWAALSARAKGGLVLGVMLVVALTLGLAMWIYSADYQVLFADLNPADAAAMTSELERQKVPYQLSDGGNTILVPKDVVYKTRLKLMGKDIPLHGAVGFEVFNNADFGMTEFVQKVNYQRAVQGELTRTILSIEGIRSARVHLAVPEQGLFKKTAAKSKASVTLIMKPGHALEPEQIAGIQRLVAASVPDIAAGDVTVLDQHGIALTRATGTDGAGESAGTQLDSKKSTEDYLTHKVTQVLDKTFGPGEAIASVDVALDLDQSRITTEDVVPAKLKGEHDGTPTGVVVRERQTVRDAPGTSAARDASAATVTSNESEYQVGRRVEQTISAPGKTRRMTVAVIVKRPLSDAQIDRIKELVGSAVGFNAQRGDAIVVSSVTRLLAAEQAGIDAATPTKSPAASTAGTSPELGVSTASTAVLPSNPAFIVRASWIVSTILTCLLAGCLLQLWRIRRRHARVIAATPAQASLTREQVLRDVRRWIDAPVQPDSRPLGVYK